MLPEVGAMLNSGTRPKAPGPPGSHLFAEFDADLDRTTHRDEAAMAVDPVGGPRFGGKRAVDQEEPSPARHRGENKAASLDDIRLLLQEQTRSLTESHQRDLRDLATFRELGNIKQDVARHGDYIHQLRDGQEKIEDRLRALEDKAAGSTIAGSDSGRPNLLIFGGWPQDTQKEVLLEELTQCLTQLGLQNSFEDYFCTGPRRGFAMALLATDPAEHGAQLKRRLINIAQQVQKANLTAPSMEEGRVLRASVGKTKHERMLSNHTGKTKRLILTVSPNSHQHLEAEYAAGNVWLRGKLVSSATRMQPHTNCSQGKLDRSWIDLPQISEMIGADLESITKQWQDLMLL